MGLFRKGKTCNIAKFQRTDLVICSHSREGKTLSYSLFQNNPKNLKPSYKMDLDLWDCLGRVKLVI